MVAGHFLFLLELGQPGHHVPAAAGIDFVSSWKGIGGFAGPYIVGLIKDKTGHFPLEVLAMAVAFLVQGCIAMAMRIDRTRPKKRGSEIFMIESKIEAPILQMRNLLVSMERAERVYIFSHP
jgi:hypothetical protein